MDFTAPQLARPFELKKDKAKFGNSRYGMQRKHDGWRLQVDETKVWTGRNGISRVIPFVQGLVDSSTRVDGELVDIEEKLSADGIAHLISEPSLHHKLKLKLFDILFLKGNFLNNTPLNDRKKMLEDYFANKLQANKVELSGWLDNRNPLVQTQEGEWSNDILKTAEVNGWEGVMIKDMTAGISPGSRANYVKWKFRITADVIIVDAEGYPSEWTVEPGCTGTDGILFPQGLHSEPWRLGYRNLRYGWYDLSGKLRITGSLGFTDTPENLKQYIGRVAEVKCYSIFPTGALKSPVFKEWRDPTDKCATDCVFNFEKGVPK